MESEGKLNVLKLGMLLLQTKAGAHSLEERRRGQTLGEQ